MPRCRALLLDFYGTLVDEDTDVIEAICQEVCRNAQAASPAEVARTWSSIFRELTSVSLGTAFRLQRDLAQMSLAATVSRYHSAADPDALLEAQFSYWQRPRIQPDTQELLATTLPACLVSNIDRADLVAALASYDGIIPVVTFPDGHQVRGDDPQADQHLQRALRRADVGLAREVGVSHFDQAPLHLITDASLSWRAAAVPDVQVDARRVRPNLVLRTGQFAALIEDAWVGRTARIGHSAVVEFTHRTERCVMINNARDGLVHSSQVLRAVAEENDLMLGIYAKVIRPGTVRLGDEVLLMDGLLK